MTTIGYLIDPIDSLNEKKDSTIEIMRKAAKLGYHARVADAGTLMFDGQKVIAEWMTVSVSDEKNWYQVTEKEYDDFDGIDAVLMRKDPPFDSEYLYSTLLLSLLPKSVKVLNNPGALRDHNEKLALLEFLEYAPETMVTSDAQKIHRMIDRLGDVIIKPLDAMGGQGIFRITANDPNRQALVDLSTQSGKRRIMVQAYLPEIKEGDKRILVINGLPIDYSLARMPTKGETRANLAAGGTGVAKPLTQTEREIATAIGQKLIQRGLFLVGLDMIGNHVTEINVTSPTCFVEIRQQTGFDAAQCFWDRLAL